MLVGISESWGIITKKALLLMCKELKRGEIRRGEECERARRLGLKKVMEMNKFVKEKQFIVL